MAQNITPFFVVSLIKYKVVNKYRNTRLLISIEITLHLEVRACVVIIRARIVLTSNETKPN